jgi:hypothetical protein
MLPATHSSAPDHEGEDSKAQRPPREKAENQQQDPGWLPEFIKLCCDRHGETSHCECK